MEKQEGFGKGGAADRGDEGGGEQGKGRGVGEERNGKARDAEKD